MNLNTDTLIQIEDILRCPVCLDMLNDAKCLPCGHTFCLSCLEQCQRHRSSAIGLRCPLCKENSVVASIRMLRSEPSEMPKNLIAQQVVEVVRNLKGVESTEDETEDTSASLLLANPVENRSRPAGNIPVHGLRRMCHWLQSNIYYVLCILLLLSVFREDHRQQLSKMSSAIGRRIAHLTWANDEWRSRVTAMLNEISERLCGIERQEKMLKTLIEEWMEKLKSLKQASKRACVKSCRQRRRAFYRSSKMDRSD